MYKLTCGKCVVCFLFLVMVAFLSCSGFRIDSDRLGAMGGFSDSSVSVASALEAAGAGARRTTRHRLRHAKHHHIPTSRIDVYVEQPAATAPSAPDGQIPQPGAAPAPTEPLTKRAQRSPARNQQQHHQQPPQVRGNRKAKPCQEQDLARKAYMANTVVLAKAESMSMSRVRYYNYSVSFRIITRFKSPQYAFGDDILRLTFLNDTRRMNCESELGGGEGGVVKAQIRPAKEYYLFLNSQGNHNYSVVGAPVLNRRKRAAEIERILRDVTRTKFEPRLSKPEVNKPEQLEPGKKARIVCKVRGFPIPFIVWKKNETVLHSNSNIRITYRGRKSTLVIRTTEERDSGRYTCVAQGVDGKRMEASTELRIANSNSHEEKCDSNLFCLNGGTCINVTDLKESYCICSDGYTGKRCDQKTILEPQPSKSDESTCEKHGVPAHMCRLR
ncbi:protein vein-like isoform X3 [Atheta coriaria]|uniref:protein vein-like isoform X3 n=1 Tax=Dalotia coriaria TaxID=877792 RepID=UPI0031F3ED8F